jgi:hypothetical protein
MRLLKWLAVDFILSIGPIIRVRPGKNSGSGANFRTAGRSASAQRKKSEIHRGNWIIRKPAIDQGQRAAKRGNLLIKWLSGRVRPPLPERVGVDGTIEEDVDAAQLQQRLRRFLLWLS